MCTRQGKLGLGGHCELQRAYVPPEGISPTRLSAAVAVEASGLSSASSSSFWRERGQKKFRCILTSWFLNIGSWFRFFKMLFVAQRNLSETEFSGCPPCLPWDVSLLADSPVARGVHCRSSPSSVGSSEGCCARPEGLEQTQKKIKRSWIVRK